MWHGRPADHEREPDGGSALRPPSARRRRPGRALRAASFDEGARTPKSVPRAAGREWTVTVARFARRSPPPRHRYGRRVDNRSRPARRRPGAGGRRDGRHLLGVAGCDARRPLFGASEVPARRLRERAPAAVAHQPGQPTKAPSHDLPRHPARNTAARSRCAGGMSGVPCASRTRRARRGSIGQRPPVHARAAMSSHARGPAPPTTCPPGCATVPAGRDKAGEVST